MIGIDVDTLTNDALRSTSDVFQVARLVAARVEQDVRQQIEQLRNEVKLELYDDLQDAAGMTNGQSVYADQLVGIERVLDELARGGSDGSVVEPRTDLLNGSELFERCSQPHCNGPHEYGQEFPLRFCSGPPQPPIAVRAALPVESCAICWPRPCGEPPYRMMCKRGGSDAN